MDGERRSWDEQGRLKSVETYFQNGKVKLQRSYRAGELDGPSRQFNADGRLAVEELCRGGFREGVGRYYDPSGRLWREVTYARDVAIGRRSYRPDGTVVEDVRLNEDGSPSAQKDFRP